jgi:RNA polymerase sigma-70 factor (ECF subfamily)
LSVLSKVLGEMPRENRTDGELLAAVVAGDGVAFAAFYQRHLSAVVGFLMRETGDREVTADLAAEVFAAVLLAARRFRPRNAASARPWVLGIARNKLLESRRRGRVEARARRRLALEPEVLDDDDLARVEELANSSGQPVLELVERLPDRQREAVRSRVLEDRAYEEIAHNLHCSELVARQHVSRGLARLRDQLKEPDR